MRVDSKKKLIHLRPNDEDVRIIMHGRDGSVLSMKALFTDKVFGLQAFSEEEGYEGDPLIVFKEGEDVGDEMDYVAIWRFY